MKNEDRKTPEKAAVYVTFPANLGDWLDEFGRNNGFTSTPELIRHIARQFKQSVIAKETKALKS